MNKIYIYGIGICFLALSITAYAANQPAATAVPSAPAAPVSEPAPALVPPMAEAGNVHGAYNFGDYRSSTLTTKAWEALADKDLDGVLAYTNKCISFYSAQAAKMQSGLKAYPAGNDQNIFSYWALNDVATSLYIQGEAYRRAKHMDEAKAAFNRIINEFSYGQTYDVNSKTFWKPVDGAQDSLYMIAHNLDLDYGNMTSSFIVKQMWQALNNKNLDEVIAYDMKLEHLYHQQALDMQKSLKDYPAGSNDQIFKYWALNDLGTGMFILGEAYQMSNKNADALNAYKKVLSDYSYAQCWDPQGWFWKPSDAAQQKMAELQAAK